MKSVKPIFNFDGQKNLLANAFILFLIGGVLVFCSFVWNNFEFLPDCLGYAAFVVAFVYLLLARDIFDSIYNVFLSLFSFFITVFLIDYIFVVVGYSPALVWWDSFDTYSAYFAAFSLAILGYAVTEKFTPYLKKLWVVVMLIDVFIMLLTFVMLDAQIETLNEFISLGEDWLYMSPVFFIIPLFFIYTFGKTAWEVKTAKNKSFRVILMVVVLGYLVYLGAEWFYLNKLERENDLANCAKTQDVTERDSCYFGLAGEYRILADCEEIQDFFQRDNCYAVIGQEGKDESICAKINNQSTKDICYQNVAFNTGKIDLCKNIQDQQTRSNCEQNF